MEGYMESIRRLTVASFVLSSLALPTVSRSPAYAVQDPPPFRQITRASWYGDEFLGRRTAGGQVFDPRKLTAAHRTLDLGTKVRVTDMRTGRSVVVEINDRGPYLPGRGIDLSYGAARALGIVRQGVAQVRIELVEREERPASPPVGTLTGGPTLAWVPKAIAE
jgi:rare lipoprotein A (peptidoglycan hydrolase)